MKNKLGKAKTPPVLASFEVQQNGNAIAVVDRDGSVYTGSIQPEIPAAQGRDLAARGSLNSVPVFSIEKPGCQPASNLDSTVKSATLFALK